MRHHKCDVWIFIVEEPIKLVCLCLEEFQTVPPIFYSVLFVKSAVCVVVFIPTPELLKQLWSGRCPSIVVSTRGPS